MANKHDYLIELKDGQYPWAPRFTAECVEHILPLVQRKWPYLATDLADAVNAVKADADECRDLLKKLAGAIAQVLASAKGSDVGYPVTANTIVVAAMELAESPDEERKWQADYFQKYKNRF